MPIPLRKPLDDKALFFPQWNCFCCHDSGIVAALLVRSIPAYETYDPSIHKNLLCTCLASSRFSDIRDAFDQGLTREWREHLHNQSFDDWMATNKAIANGCTERDLLMGAIKNFSQAIGA